MVQLQDLVSYLDGLLEPDAYGDASLNGIQVESLNSKIELAAFAVDAGLSVLEEAVRQKASILIVHHGIFWGHEQAIIGPHRDKIYALLNGGCSLYTSHIPLDAHTEVGNNFELARILKLNNLKPFFEYQGKNIGCSGELDKPESLNYFIDSLSQLEGAIEPTILPFGPKEIKTVGIITGSGSPALSGAKAQNLDLLISGEPKHESYHSAKELGMNAIFAGHYATETVGPKALMRKVQKDLKVNTTFIHEGTGI